MGLNELVRSYWEQVPCGTGEVITHGLEPGSREWYQQVEAHRYRLESCIHSIAQFTRHRGEKLLEVGVGAGTDHLQWARAGCDCYGVDLTDAAVETTRAHLALYGLESKLQRVDAEELPFPDDTFDVVYSWGVIHHSENPERIIAEIRRVLKPGGEFIGMLYGRRSPLAFKEWVKNALLKGRPWRSFSDVLWNHVESVGTKAYTVSELGRLFSNFETVSFRQVITAYDKDKWPRWLSKFFPDDWGWFIGVAAHK